MVFRLMTSPELHDDVTTLAREDRERYLCALTAPRRHRDALMALIAYNREIAGIPQTVSEPMLGKIKLQWWIDVMPGIMQGRPPSHPVAQALSEALAGASVQMHLSDQGRALRALAEARNFDLETSRPENLEVLVAHAQATGGALQALMLAVLGVEDRDAQTAAAEIGTAWALIGFMRALPYQNGGRDLLPQNCTVRDVLARAEALLASARDRQVPKDALPALVVARLADRHLKRLAAQGWDPAAREEPPAGVGAVLNVWWGSLSGRY